MKILYKVLIGFLLFFILLWVVFTPHITYLSTKNPANTLVYQDNYVTIRGQYDFDETIKKMCLKFTIDKQATYEGDFVDNDSARLVFSVDVYDTIPKIRKNGYGVGYEEIQPARIYLDNEFQKFPNRKRKWKQKIVVYEVATNNEAPEELKFYVYSCIKLRSVSLGELWTDGQYKEAFMEEYSQVYNGRQEVGLSGGCWPLDFTIRKSVVASFWKVYAWKIL